MALSTPEGRDLEICVFLFLEILLAMDILETLMANPNVTELDDSNFDAFLAGAHGPVLVDFWAPWCAPCRMLGPVVDEIATESVGKFHIAKVNVDESPGVSSKFGIRSIPALIFFKGGEKKEQTVGVTGKADIVRRLEALV